jgi:hypothetical protein
MIARHQRVGNRAFLPNLRARVMGVFEQPLGEAFLGERLGVADHPGKQPHAGVDQRDRRRLAARQHKIAEAHLLDPILFENPLVDPFEPAADQPHPGAGSQLAHP